MSDTAHSWFPPSSAHRSIKCPAWIEAAKKLPDCNDDNNGHAQKGTECHEAMQASVAMGMPMWEAGDFTEPKDQLPLCEDAWDMLNEMLDAHKPDVIMPEKRVNLSPYGYPDIFGTVDIVAYNESTRTLVIIDYKFGYNEVEVQKNEQLMTYAAGAMTDYDVDSIILCIIQPQVSKTAQTWTTSPIELLDWFSKVLKPAIIEAQSDSPRFNPGEAQCRYCPVAKHGCKYQAQQYLTAIETFQPSEAFELDDAKLVELVDMIPAMKDAIKAVEVALVNRLTKGNSPAISGKYKLVERQTKRRWKDAEEAATFLKSKRFKLADIYSQKVISPAAGEKLMKTKRFSTAVTAEFRELIEKPTGGKTYAPINDKRKAIEVNEVAAVTEETTDDIL